MKHLFYLAVVVALGLAIFTFAAGLAGQVDIISMGREIMSAGWSLAGALGF